MWAVHTRERGNFRQINGFDRSTGLFDFCISVHVCVQAQLSEADAQNVHCQLRDQSNADNRKHEKLTIKT